MQYSDDGGGAAMRDSSSDGRVIQSLRARPVGSVIFAIEHSADVSECPNECEAGDQLAAEIADTRSLVAAQQLDRRYIKPRTSGCWSPRWYALG